MKYEIIISGRGGQGVLLAGYILGLAAAKYMGFHVVNSESYGAETRGGETTSDIIISSEEEIDELRVERADVGMFLHQSGLDRNINRLKEDVLLIVDSDLVKNIKCPIGRIVSIPISRTVEEELGTKLPSNIAMLGVFSKVTNLVSMDALEGAVREAVKLKYLELNLKALRLGYKMV